MRGIQVQTMLVSSPDPPVMGQQRADGQGFPSGTVRFPPTIKLTAIVQVE